MLNQSNPFRTRWLMLLALVVVVGLSAHADNFRVGQLNYIADPWTKTAYVTFETSGLGNYATLTGTVEIPASITFSGKEYLVTAIGNSAFAKARGITGVIIPNTVKKIDINAFDYCTSLSSLILPATVEEVGTDAFYGCVGLKELRIEDGTTSLKLNATYSTSGGSGTFAQCPLEKLYMGRNIEYPTVSSSPFIGYPDRYGYSAFYDRYNSRLKSVVIGPKVTALPQYLFYNCRNLVNVEILSQNITKILEYTFYKTAISQIKLPDSVTLISFYAFAENSHLQSIGLGSSLATIDGYAFQNTGLVNVSFPNTLTSIGMKAFYATQLTEIILPKHLTSLGTDAFSACAEVTKVHMGDMLTAIPDNCFSSCSKLSKIHFGNKVATIGSRAFASCTSLSNLSLPASIVGVESKAFANCTGLKELWLEDGTNALQLLPSFDDYKGAFADSPLEEVYIGRNIIDLSSEYPNNPLGYGYSPFYREYDSRLKRVVIGPEVTSLPEYLFHKCDKIESILSLNNSVPTAGANTFPPSIRSQAVVYAIASSVADYRSSSGWRNFFYYYPMFADGTMLYIPMSNNTAMVARYPHTFPETISIPAAVVDGYGQRTVTEVMSGAFKGNPNLTVVELPASLRVIGKNAFACNVKLASINFGGAVYVGDYAFADCPSITSITLPESVEEIGNNCFVNNSSITSISFGANLRRIGSEAFAGCNALTAIKLPNAVESLGSRAFADCIKLTYVTLGQNMKDVGDYAFSNCKALTEIALAPATETVGNGAFQDCVNLAVPTLNNGLKTMGNDTFKGCSSLMSISVPGSVTSIGNGSFDGCTMLSSVNFQAGAEPLWIAHFTDSPVKTLRIGRNLQYDFTATSSPFYGKQTLTRVLFSGNNVTNIYDHLLDGCDKLTSITLPSTLQSINPYAFHKSGLTKINIPAATATLGDYSFASCADLSEVSIADGTHKIGNYAFSSNPVLKTAIIGDGPATIGNYTFSSNPALTTVTLGEGTATIGNYAFADCETLPDIVLPNTVTDLGQYAFTNDLCLRSITLSNSLKAIQKGTFLNCPVLAGLSVPASVQSIGDDALAKCVSMKKLRLEDCAQSISMGLALHRTEADGLPGLCSDTPLDSLYIGRNINYSATLNCGYSPFYGIKTLKNVEISKQGCVTELGDYLLARCSAIDSLSMPASITTVGEYACWGDSSLTKVQFSPNVKTLRNSLFRDCVKLAAFEVHPAVTKIENNVFTQCTAMRSIAIDNGGGMLTIGRKEEGEGYSSLFADAPLTKVHLGRWLIYDVTDEKTSPFYSQTQLTQLTLGNTVGDLGKFLFEKCSALPSVEIPGIESVGEKAFAECSALKTVKLSEGIKSIGDQAFARCTSLGSVSLPSTVVSLADGSFMQCTAMQGAELGSSLEIIGPRAFQGCTAMNDLNIPPTVYGLGVESFKDCVSLTGINIPIGISSVGARAFQGCSGAKVLSLSPRVTSLGAQSFEGCNQLEVIRSMNEVPPVGMPGFSQQVLDNAVVFVPEGFVPDYQDADTWWEFADIRDMAEGNGVESIELNHSAISFEVGQSVQLNATSSPQPCAVAYRSYNPEIATVDATGQVTAVALGETQVKVFAADGSGVSAVCTVAVVPTLAREITVVAPSVNIKKGRGMQLSANVTPANVTDAAVQWSVSDAAVATVDEQGYLHAITAGQVDVTATAVDGSGTNGVVTIWVSAPLKGDSNDNDAVNVADALHTANYVVGKHQGEFNIEAADVNEDGRITISDAAGTVTIALDMPAAAPARSAGADAAVAAADLLQVRRPNILPGETRRLAIELSNAKDYYGFQTDIVLPAGVTVVEDANGNIDVNTGGTVLDGFTLVANRMADGNVRVAAFATDHRPMSDVTGNLLELNLTAADDFGGGTLSLVNTLLINAADQDVELPDYEVELLPEAYNRTAVQDVDTKTNQTVPVAVELDNDTEFAGFQMDLCPSKHIEIDVNSIQLTNRAAGHSLSVKALDNGAVRIVCVALDGNTFSGESGALLTFNMTIGASAMMDSELALKNQLFVTPSATELAMPNTVAAVRVGDGTTGVYDVADGEPTVSVRGGEIVVNGIARGVEVSIYTPDGQLLDREVSTGEDVIFNVPARQLYLIQAANRSWKVAIE